MFTLPDLLKRGDPDQVSIVDGCQRTTRSELLERSRGLAGLLQAKGLKKGETVAVYLPKSTDAVAALFAVQLAGGVAVIVYERLRARQVRYIADHSEARFLITNTGQLRYVSGFAEADARIINLDESGTDPDSFSEARVIGADLALILYTSGSTGFPKGVMLSHANLVSGARIVADYLRLGEGETIISLLPLSFDYGLNQLMTALLVNGTLVLQRSAFPPDVCNTLRQEAVTGMAGVPTLWHQLTQDRSPFMMQGFPHLRYVTNSGGALPKSVVKKIRDTHPDVEVHLMYGLTEAFRSTHLPPGQVDVRPTSMGKAIPDVEILLVDEEGNACGPGEIGEVVHRGANVALGYWRDPRKTAEVFRPHPHQMIGNGVPETVVYSGDLAKRDAEGYLYFVGRKDQLIKSRGFRVSPEEVESYVYASDLVSSVVAFAVPGARADSEIVAAVVPKRDPATPERALKDYCRREMPEYLSPGVIWRIESLPLTTSGKPDRTALREAYVRQAG